MTTRPPRWICSLRWSQVDLDHAVVVVVTSLQALGEELFFRGYVLQALDLKSRRRWLLVMISALMFALPHAVNITLGEDCVIELPQYLWFAAFFAPHRCGTKSSPVGAAGVVETEAAELDFLARVDNDLGLAPFRSVTLDSVRSYRSGTQLCRRRIK